MSVVTIAIMHADEHVYIFPFTIDHGAGRTEERESIMCVRIIIELEGLAAFYIHTVVTQDICNILGFPFFFRPASISNFKTQGLYRRENFY